MPGSVTGYELARKLFAEKPELKVIYTSGYSADLGGRHSLLVEGVNFLQKPYAPQALAAILRQSLESDPEKQLHLFGRGLPSRISSLTETGRKAQKISARGISKFPRGTVVILLAEDDLAVRQSVSNMLQRFGYRVLITESGGKALKVWQNNKEHIDLLLTDIVMPDGIDGYELARRLQADKPQLKVIYTSGHSLGQGNKHSPLIKGVNFLPKPYAPQKLAEILRSSLKVGSRRRINF